MPELREIKCIIKNDRSNPHERIQAVGGNSAGRSWIMEQQEAVRAIEGNRIDFFVSSGVHKVDVIVATSRFGHKYLKTKSDGEIPNNLLALNSCPI